MPYNGGNEVKMGKAENMDDADVVLTLASGKRRYGGGTSPIYHGDAKSFCLPDEGR